MGHIPQGLIWWDQNNHVMSPWSNEMSSALFFFFLTFLICHIQSTRVYIYMFIFICIYIGSMLMILDIIPLLYSLNVSWSMPPLQVAKPCKVINFWEDPKDHLFFLFFFLFFKGNDLALERIYQKDRGTNFNYIVEYACIPFLVMYFFLDKPLYILFNL